LQVLIDKTLNPKEAPVYQEYNKIMKWADKYRRLKFEPMQTKTGSGQLSGCICAEGIGLCRTEHMFFGEGKIGPIARDDSCRYRRRTKEGAGEFVTLASDTILRGSSRHAR